MNLYNMTNRMKLSLINKTLVFTIICLGINVWGQNVGEPHQYNNLEKFYPKSPAASSFEKFINIPQANYTGIHGYSVPIYSIQGKDFTFPVTINYHGMGVNVNEISGVVGLGWNLSVGGINLSQEIRGYDDATSSKVNIENGSDFYSANVQFNWNENLNNQSEQFYNAAKIAGGYYNGHITYLHETPYRQEYEFSPDYFNYSLLNNSGKFIIDRAGNFQTIPKDNVDISGNIYEVIITDKKGIKYTFSRYHHSNNQSQLFVVNESFAYRLQSIYFPESKKTMNFAYENISYKYISNYQHNRSYLTSGSVTNSTQLLSPEKKSRTTTQVINDYIVSKISYDDTVVEFIYAGESANDCSDCNGGRKDINGGKKLKEILVKYKPVNGTEKIIKGFIINTSYTEGSGGAPTGAVYLPDYPPRTFTYRLRLNSINEVSSNTIYSFDYEDQKILPSRFSQYTDFWGSYTMPKYNNNEYLPSFIYKKTINSERKYFDGANKEPDLEYAKTGALKRVHFPTGGYQEFHYGLDDYKFNDTEVKYEERYFNLPTIDDPVGAYNWSTPSYYIIDQDPHYRKGLDYILTFATLFEPCDFEDPHGEFGGNLPTGVYYDYELYEVGNPTLLQNYIIKQGVEYQLPEFDESKNYYFKVVRKGSGSGNCNPPQYPISITPQINYFHESDPIHINNKTAGNLRVDAITLHDSAGDTLVKRRFEYKNFSDPTFSSGVFTGIPIHRKQYTQSPGMATKCLAGHPEDPFCHSAPSDNNEIITNNPALNLNVSFGKSVFYENVTEIYEDLKNPSNSYRKEMVFKLPDLEEGYPVVESSPTTYLPHNEYTGGQLLEERLYNNTFNPNNRVNSLVKKIVNNYVPDYYFNSQSNDYQGGALISFGVSAALESYSAYDCSSIGCSIAYDHDTNVYYITSGWIKHLSTTEEDYKNGVLTMTNITNYNYSPTYSHLNAVSVTNTNSLGHQVKTEYEYTHPYKKDEPTIVRHYENGTAMSVQQTKFYASGLPQYVFAKKGASTLDSDPPSEDLKITYNSYDSQGNLTQYTKENGTPVSIIWGYNGQYPIAKVEGVPYTALSAYISTLQPLSNNGTLTAASFDALRNGMNTTANNALVTCYIYKPLVGVTTIIHPHGQQETYEYDNAGRLMHVRDHQGNILKKAEYNYQQP